MNVIDTLAQGLDLAAGLLGTARGRAKRVGSKAKDVVRDLRDEAATSSDQLRSRLKRIRNEPSASTKALQFIAGLGVGVGVGLLFAPWSGKRLREKLLESTSGPAFATTSGVSRQEDEI
jgi:gas vesicle protein